jgi:vacuolar-type H+-ATPase subunit I/STV1
MSAAKEGDRRVGERGDLKRVLDALDILRRRGWKVLIRTDGFKTVGVVTTKRMVWDTGMRKNRTVCAGVELGGGVFQEPLDRANYATGEFESTVELESEHFIVTARRAPEGEKDDNFVYLISPYSAEEQKMLKRRVEELQASVTSLQSQIDGRTRERDFFAEQLDTARAEVRELRNRNAALVRENTNLRMMEDYYRAHMLARLFIAQQAEATIRSLLDHASQTGMELGKPALEQAKTVLRGLREVREEEAGLIPYPSGELEAEIRKARERLEALERSFKEATAAPEEKAKAK